MISAPGNSSAMHEVSHLACTWSCQLGALRWCKQELPGHKWECAGGASVREKQQRGAWPSPFKDAHKLCWAMS